MRPHVATTALWLALLALQVPAWADEGGSSDPVAVWPPLDPAALDTLRGGFVLPSGLQVSFGFERQVHVNGALVSALRVQVADVARISAEEAAQLAMLGQTQRVQIGAGQAVQAQAGGLLIQNALDGQRIQVQTTLDASSNALGMLQALNAAQALQAGAVRAVGGP